MRLAPFAILSFLFGTGVALLFPPWQECLVAAGEEREIRRVQYPVEMTLELRATRHRFYVYEPEETEELVRESRFEAPHALSLIDPQSSIDPATLTWSGSSGRSRTTYTAPGLRIRLAVTAVARPDQPDDWYPVTWSCPALAAAEAKTYVSVHGGMARWENGRLLLRRLRVLPSAGARRLALLPMALGLGLPHSLGALFVLMAVFTLRNPPFPPEDPSGGRVVFPRSNKGARLYFSLWGGILYFTAIVAAFATYSSDANLIDLPESVAWLVGLALFPIPILAFTLWFMRKRQIELEATPDGVTVRRGPSDAPAFAAAWSDLVSVTPGVWRYRGGVADEWVDLASRDGQWIRIARYHVQEFARLREFLLRRVSGEKPAAG